MPLYLFGLVIEMREKSNRPLKKQKMLRKMETTFNYEIYRSRLRPPNQPITTIS